MAIRIEDDGYGSPPVDLIQAGDGLVFPRPLVTFSLLTPPPDTAQAQAREALLCGLQGFFLALAHAQGGVSGQVHPWRVVKTVRGPGALSVFRPNNAVLVKDPEALIAFTFGVGEGQ
jgi:hypothetical protein